MQQRKSTSRPTDKAASPVPAAPSKPAPVVLDEKALRQVAGGMNVPMSPNGGW
jgi:hypothetical protein